MQALRITGESLKQDTGTAVSQELRADGQIADLVRIGLSASGSLNWEMSYGAHDELFQAALLSATWTSPATATGTVYSVVAGSGQFTIHRSSGSFVSDSFAANMWVNVTGFATAANNGFAKVVSVSASDMVVKYNGNGVNEAAGATVTLYQGGQIVNGTTFRSFAIEREYQDLSNEFAMFNGMCIDTFNLNVAANAILTGSFGFMGKKETSANATAASVVTAATTEDVMNAVDDVQAVIENGARFDITAFSMALGNNLRQRLQVATLGAISIGRGTIDVTGNLNYYYGSKALMDKYLGFTATSLALILRKNSKGYIIDYPRVKFKAGERPATGINTDVMGNMQYQAFRDPTENTTIRIQRFATM
jgi:hypothetical protein